MQISLFGLGYVGAVSAACFSNLNHRVIGLDISQHKVDLINSGVSTVKETDLDSMTSTAVKGKRLSATTDVEKAVLNSEISFICVGTPANKNGSVDISALKSVCKNLGLALRKKDNHIIVIRSTLFPMYLKEIVKIIEEESKKKEGSGFHIAVNPEFLREGSAVKDFFNPPCIVVGAFDKKVAAKVFEAYKGIKSKRFIVKPELAQMIKYVNNSWHALKVGFTNEIASVCKEEGIDAKKLMSLFSEDKQLNISSYYMKPGFAYGGSCLPKDLLALKMVAKKRKLNLPIINSVSESNIEHIKRAISLVKSTKKKKIGILGISFKENTDDIRGNPILFVINHLLNLGYSIKIFDPIVSKENLSSISNSYRKEVFDLINQEDLKEEVAEIGSLFESSEKVLNQEVIILSNRGKSFSNEVSKLKKEQILIDLQKTFDKKDTPAMYLSL